MTFYDELQQATASERDALLNSPVIVDCLQGRVTLEIYCAFLVQAYHHVRHTVPLLMACGSRLPDRLAWLQPAIVEYIAEEEGHELWIRDDIAATGADADALLGVGPHLATEVMVSYAYDTVHRVDPIGLFGMIYVLEGTSVALATRAAQALEDALRLPREAFSYLRSHGSLDREHISNYRQIVDRLEEDGDRTTITRCAKAFFALYAGMFESLPHFDAGRAARGRAAA